MHDPSTHSSAVGAAKSLSVPDITAYIVLVLVLLADSSLEHSVTACVRNTPYLLRNNQVASASSNSINCSRSGGRGPVESMRACPSPNLCSFRVCVSRKQQLKNRLTKASFLLAPDIQLSSSPLLLRSERLFFCFRLSLAHSLLFTVLRSMPLGQPTPRAAPARPRTTGTAGTTSRDWRWSEPTAYGPGLHICQW